MTRVKNAKTFDIDLDLESPPHPSLFAEQQQCSRPLFAQHCERHFLFGLVLRFMLASNHDMAFSTNRLPQSPADTAQTRTFP